MKKIKIINGIFYAILIGCVVGGLLEYCGQKKEPIIIKGEKEYVDSNKVLHKTYSDKEFNDLKELNRSLYDSLKVYKDEINYLIQFKYRKDYSTGKVILQENVDTASIDTISETFVYEGGTNDSIGYKLSINSPLEPNWYQLDLSVNEKFTIVNKHVGDMNELTISTGNKGEIEDITAFNKQTKRKFWDRFSYGPTIGVGYNLHNRIEPYIGFGIMYDLRKRK